MAMFESLSKRLEGVFTNLSGKGKLTEADVNEAMREVRLALLEGFLLPDLVFLMVAHGFPSMILSSACRSREAATASARRARAAGLPVRTARSGSRRPAARAPRPRSPRTAPGS